MGVILTPIITKETISLSALRGRTLAVDGHGELYQFLALIRRFRLVWRRASALRFSQP